MHIADKAANRHCRIGAVTDQIIPVAIAQLGDVEPKRSQQILGMTRRQSALRELLTQRHAFRIAIACAVEIGLELIEQGEFLVRFELGVICNVIGGAHEVIEGENRRAVARMDEPRRDWKILIPVRLARPQLASIAHDRTAGAWARPFHMPPRPRACATADAQVNHM